MGRLCKESNKSVRKKCNAGPKKSAVGVSMMQRKILTAAAAAITGSRTRKGSKLVYPQSSQVTKEERLKEQLAHG
jgi:hypothetical protein